MFFYATGITPAMAMKRSASAPQYAGAFVDAESQPLDGSQDLPAAPAAEHPGQELLVDRGLRQPDPLDAADRPAVPEHRQPEERHRRSTPTPRWMSTSARRRRQAMRANWVQTIPGKGWNVLLRLYGPLEPWFDKTWRPGEIEHLDA